VVCATKHAYFKELQWSLVLGAHSSQRTLGAANARCRLRPLGTKWILGLGMLVLGMPLVPLGVRQFNVFVLLYSFYFGWFCWFSILI